MGALRLLLAGATVAPRGPSPRWIIERFSRRAVSHARINRIDQKCIFVISSYDGSMFVSPEMLLVPLAQMKTQCASTRYNCKNVRRPGKAVILQYSLAGVGMFEVNGVVHPVQAGHALLALVPERSRYFYPPRGQEPWVFRWLDFNGELAMRLWRGFRERFGPVAALPLDSPAEILLRELIQIVNSQACPDSFLVGELAYQFYLTWWRQLEMHGPRNPLTNPIEEAEKFCRQHFRRPVTVKEIAEHVHLTREHLTRQFTAQFGLGPSTYLRALRLKEAQWILRSTGLPLKEVAQRTGFSSPRSLSSLLQVSRQQNAQSRRSQPVAGEERSADSGEIPRSGVRAK